MDFERGTFCISMGISSSKLNITIWKMFKKNTTGVPTLVLFKINHNKRSCCVFTCNLLDVLMIGLNGFKRYVSQPHLLYDCTIMKRPNSVHWSSHVVGIGIQMRWNTIEPQKELPHLDQELPHLDQIYIPWK